jgi:hypothetical protein
MIKGYPTRILECSTLQHTVELSETCKDESDLSDLRSPDFDTVGVETGRQDSRVGDKEVEVEVEAPASPA